MPIYSSPGLIQGRSISDIYNGRLHNYSALYHVPHNPMPVGALRFARRSISLDQPDSPEHNKTSEGEKKEIEQKKEELEKKRKRDIEREDDIEIGGV